MFLTGTVSYLVAFAILGQDDKDQLTPESVKDFSVRTSSADYLTIISRARMGSESIAHEAEGRMGYWLRAHEGERYNCFSKIQPVGQKNIEAKQKIQQNAIHPPLFWFPKPALFATSGL